MRARAALAVVTAAVAVNAAAGGAAASDQAQPTMRALLSLKLDTKGLAKFATAVSTPDNKQYGRYQSVAKLTERFGASSTQTKSVVSYLHSRGVSAEVAPTGTYVVAEVSRSQAEQLFNVEVETERAGAKGVAAFAADKPTVPAALRSSVSGVSGLDERPTVKRLGRFEANASGASTPAEHQSSAMVHSGTASGCSQGVAASAERGTTAFTPNQIATAYGYSDLNQRAITGVGERIAVIEIDGFKPSDIQTFGECFGLKPPPIWIKLAGIDKPLAPSGETTLDLEVLTMAAPGARSIGVYQGNATNAGLVETISAAVGERKRPPTVISISLGGCEPGMQGGIYAVREMDTQFMLAAGAGIAVHVSAGDTGVNACAGGENTSALPLGSVETPASSPWVTAVGGTNFQLSPQNAITNEIVWNESPNNVGAGGGGSSILQSRPSWQKGRGTYGSMRTVPDIAMLADNTPGWTIYCTADSLCRGRGWLAVGGTSASSPLMAGGTARINQRLVATGRTRVGFASPLLYTLAQDSRAYRRVFRDIVKYDNDTGPAIPASMGGGGPDGCCYAAPYYDTASGWGSVAVDELLDAALGRLPKTAK